MSRFSCVPSGYGVLSRSLARGCAVLAIAAGANAQTTDCDGNGVDDALEWGPNYAYWDGNGEGNDGGSLNNWFEWCATDFNGLNPLDRLVFGQDPGQSMDLCTMSGNLTAWSLRMDKGAFEISSNAAILMLTGTLESPSQMEVNGTLALDANVVQSNPSLGGAVSIGHSGGTGVLEVRGHGLTALTSDMLVGTTGQGELKILGGSVSTLKARVGEASNESPQVRGQVLVGPAGSFHPSASLDIADVVTVDGVVRTNSATGPSDSWVPRGVLTGSGWIDGAIDGRGLLLVPRRGLGSDGLTDATLTVNKCNLATSGGSAILRIGIEVESTSGVPIVPRIQTTTSCQPGGLLQLDFTPDSVDKVIGFNSVVKGQGMSPGNFKAAQLTGLPMDRTVRVERRAGAEPGVTELGFTVMDASPPPVAQSGPMNSLLRVTVDALLADFNGDGVKDAAMAMAMDASGTSQVRFFEVGLGNVLNLKATIDVMGDARQLAALPGNAGAGGIALSLGTANKIALLRGGGDWQFAVDYLAVGVGAIPTGIAVGRFVDASATTATDIAVGCVGSTPNQVVVFHRGTSGQYALGATVNNCRADVLRSVRTAAGTSDGLLALDRAAKSVHFVTRMEFPTPTIASLVIAEDPTSATVLDVAGPTSAPGAVITVNGASSNPDHPVENALLLRLAGGSIDPVLWFNMGNNPLSVAAADFDEDGNDDMAAATTIDGVEQVRLFYNRTDAASPDVIILQDGGKMPGSFHRPRIVFACDADGTGKPKVLSVNAGVGSGGSLGPEFDGGIGTFGSGNAAGDVNGDGVVDGNDMTAVFSAWGTADPVADINDDGIVDAFDMATILSGWTAP